MKDRGCHHRGVADDWRYEADDQWLAGRRSTFFKRRRSRFASAVADAQLGPFRGAPRNPALKLTDKGYAHVRYAPRSYSYLAVQVELLRCGSCGHRLLEEHRLVLRHSEGPHRTLGLVRMCRRCQKEAWLFISHMPSARVGRRRDAKAVL
jgi:hypothetical protein